MVVFGGWGFERLRERRGLRLYSLFDVVDAVVVVVDGRLKRRYGVMGAASGGFTHSGMQLEAGAERKSLGLDGPQLVTLDLDSEFFGNDQAAPSVSGVGLHRSPTGGMLGHITHRR